MTLFLISVCVIVIGQIGYYTTSTMTSDDTTVKMIRISDYEASDEMNEAD